MIGSLRSVVDGFTVHISLDAVKLSPSPVLRKYPARDETITSRIVRLD